MRLDPSAGVRVKVETRRAFDDQPEATVLEHVLGPEGGEGPTPYEVLPHAAVIGDCTRFARQDGVEQRWRIMQPLLDEAPPVEPYSPGTWGPPSASRLLAEHGGWHEPWADGTR